MARSKRRIALSFVTTVSVVSGCHSSQPDTPDGDGTATATISAPEPTVTTTTSAVVTPPSASGSVPPTCQPEMRKWVAGTIAKSGAECAFTEEVADSPCPPNVDCNPPRPFVTTVACPPGSVKLPAKTSILNEQGECFYFPPLPPMNCSPTATCNPPPPQRTRIECPPRLRSP